MSLELRVLRFFSQGSASVAMAARALNVDQEFVQDLVDGDDFGLLLSTGYIFREGSLQRGYYLDLVNVHRGVRDLSELLQPERVPTVLNPFENELAMIGLAPPTTPAGSPGALELDLRPYSVRPPDEHEAQKPGEDPEDHRERLALTRIREGS